MKIKDKEAEIIQELTNNQDGLIRIGNKTFSIIQTIEMSDRIIVTYLDWSICGKVHVFYKDELIE